MHGEGGVGERLAQQAPVVEAVPQRPLHLQQLGVVVRRTQYGGLGSCRGAAWQPPGAQTPAGKPGRSGGGGQAKWCERRGGRRWRWRAAAAGGLAGCSGMQPCPTRLLACCCCSQRPWRGWARLGSGLALNLLHSLTRREPARWLKQSDRKQGLEAGTTHRRRLGGGGAQRRRRAALADRRRAMPGNLSSARTTQLHSASRGHAAARQRVLDLGLAAAAEMPARVPPLCRPRRAAAPGRR